METDTGRTRRSTPRPGTDRDPVGGGLPAAEVPGVGPPAGPPPNTGLLGEVRTLGQPLRLVARLPALARAPRGSGRPVVVAPGWRTDGRATAPLRAWLSSIGHDAHDWGLGTNTGDPLVDRDRLEPLVEQLARTRQDRVALVGWSLGGVVVRELARRRPDLVRAVVVYGTPVTGGPTHTAGARAMGPDRTAYFATQQEQSNREQPVAVPLTSVFSRRDGVVDWRASIDHWSPRARHVEVRSTHLGLGIDPDVWLVVARVLAA